jgi:protein-glutamine gamma-glutamyltransferase
LVRTGLLCLLPVLLIATGWRQLELPAEGRELALVSILPIAVALLPRRLQLAASGVALLVAVELAFGLRPVRGVFSEFPSGVVDFYEVTLPFDPGEHERMHGVVLMTAFAFALGVSLAIARRRALLAASLTFAGAAWPVTLIRDAPTAARGALLLVSALILLAALRAGPRLGSGQTVLVGGGVVLAALIAVSSPAVAKGGFLNWEQWEPYTRPAKPVDVSYVWDSNYAGIDFPERGTTVLTIKAPPRAPYWRATTLDAFFDDHWRQDATPIQPVDIQGRDALVEDPLVPPTAWEAADWMHQEVRVRALRDNHLVAATMPIAFERGAASLYSPGVAHAPVRRNQEYEAWSYVRRPTPEQLARSRPDYPDEIVSGTFLETPSGFAPPFGSPARDARMSTLLRGRFGDPRYDQLYETARSVVGRPRNPYAAVIALEAWFRSSSFTYDESPPASRGVPPLVAFVTDYRRGYCQHYAGAMALMLRYLGIPARVGAGFTTGRYDQGDGEYTVSDTNAHTWVEVWFAGYGWLPFDPTPGRGRLLSNYTASSTFFDASAAIGALGGVAAGGLGLQALQSRLADAEGGNDEQPRGLDGAARPRQAARDESDGGLRDSLLVLLLVLSAAVLSGLWTFKAVRRRSRYLTSDPRRVAGAVRLELVDYLLDQRLPMSPSATPAEVGDELERTLGIAGYRFADALAEARYGPEAHAGAAAARARNELRVIRRALRRRLGAGEKLRGLLSFRSLGLGH